MPVTITVSHCLRSVVKHFSMKLYHWQCEISPSQSCDPQALVDLFVCIIRWRSQFLKSEIILSDARVPGKWVQNDILVDVNVDNVLYYTVEVRDDELDELHRAADCEHDFFFAVFGFSLGGGGV